MCGKPEAIMYGRSFSVICDLRVALNAILSAGCSVRLSFPGTTSAQFEVHVAYLGIVMPDAATSGKK